MKLTDAQRAAVAANGNVLVVAGAGAGKTRTLVERCLARILDPHDAVGIDEILMMTFTEAAAAEMKERIRARLNEELARPSGKPARERLIEQLALLDTAHIGTLHGFCLRLVRDHFHELGIDPQISVLADEQARVLMEETLDEIFRAHYAGLTPAGAAVQELIETQAGGRELFIRDHLLKLHHYTQTLPDPAGWFERQRAHFHRAEPEDWRVWLREGFHQWRALWLPELRAQPAENKRAHAFAAQLGSIGKSPSNETRAQLLEDIVAADADWPRGTKAVFRGPVEPFYTDAAFLHSLTALGDGADPLAEDWGWVRRPMETLLMLAEEFSNAFGQAKRGQGALDFHDFEQFALRLLWDRATTRPTRQAEQLRRKFRLVFVDEYQDINAAQDRIIEALGGEAEGANRFLVGDVKQSIYRFRLSDPRIFQRHRRDWRDAARSGRVISLAENFRSREALLSFINPIFGELMREEIGGVACGDEDALRFGESEQRAPLSLGGDPEPRVELHLCITGQTESEVGTGDGPDSAGPADVAQLTSVEREARAIARRLRELKAQGHLVWDERGKTFRPARWNDMAILLRSVRNNAEVFAKECHRQGVPLEAERGGFYENTEITDLLSLLQLLDNPLQDVPLLAVLRSPLVGLSLAELAEIRLAHRDGHFWTALTRWRDIERSRSEQPVAKAMLKVDTFLDRFRRWRRMSRATSLSHRIEAVLNETLYFDWLLTQARGPQRQVNVRRLLALAQRFDPLQRHGLQRFLRFVEAQREADTDSEPAPAETADAVRLMSIHKSKGLEFPVVVVAGLGGRFNLRELGDGVILDEVYGLCPQVKPAQTRRLYPSLPYWLARARQQRESLGEELRLLYVAFTRARDTLVLAGTVPQKTAAERWSSAATERLTDRSILGARCCLDWLGPFLTRQMSGASWVEQSTGQTPLFRWNIHRPDDELAPDDPGARPDEPIVARAPIADARELQRLKERIEWRYPFAAAGRHPAKTSVSLLRRGVRDELEDEAIRPPWLKDGAAVRRNDARSQTSTAPLSAAEIGTAHHVFLQLISPDGAGGRRALEGEAARLQTIGALTAEEVASLDFDGVLAFWQSELGRRILSVPDHVHRELPFTMRFSTRELSELNLLQPAGLNDGEFFVVQGVVDLAVIQPSEIWLVDFKTDAMKPGELDTRRRHYEPQLKLYGLALGRIYGRPVTESWLHFLSSRETVRV